MALRLPLSVRIVEVGPRDGLQNEAIPLSTDDKIRMIDLLSETGVGQIEVTSFVNPRWIPPLSDGFEVATRIRRRPGTVYSALVPNEKGYDNARRAGFDTVALIISASETHNKKNINHTVAESLAEYRKLVARATSEGVRVRSYLSTAFGCPYEGPVARERVKDIVLDLLDMGVYQISLGDTTGMANPQQVSQLLDVLGGALSGAAPMGKFALHFHDTRGTALANVVAGLLAGVTTYDAAVGGLGGCPYAPGASGNAATEDLVAMLDGMGIATGVDLEKVMACSRFLQEAMGKELPSRYLKSQLARTHDDTKAMSQT